MNFITLMKRYGESSKDVITEKEAICYLLSETMSAREIAKALGVSHTLVADWVKHVRQLDSTL